MNIPPNGAGIGVREDGSIAALPHIEPREHQQTDATSVDDSDLRAQLDALKAELAAKDLELAREKKKSHRVAHKSRVAKKTHVFVDVDPEKDLDGEFAGCTALADFLKKGLGLLYLDTGPSEEKGLPMTGALLIERHVRRSAVKHGTFSDAFFADASEPSELKIAGRFNLVQHWLARGVNAYEFFLAVQAYGLEGARARKASLPRLDVRGFDHLIAEADADATLTIVNSNNEQEK